MKLKLYVFSILLILTSFLAACGNNEEQAAEEVADVVEEGGEVLELYTTIFPLEDFARKIGGEYVNVTNLVPVGSDAHTFEPTAREMIEVAEGDAFIYNGAGLEGFVDALIETLKSEDVAIVKAAEGIELLELDDLHHDHGHEEEGHEEHAHDEHAHEEDGHDHAHEEESHEGHDHSHDQDPHVWLDPIHSITLAKNIKEALVELMPEQEETFTANFEQVKADLEEIDRNFREMVDSVSKDTFLVSHEGYGYWEARYGLKQIGIAGISPTSEPSQSQMLDLINKAKELDLQYVLFEQNIPSKLAEVVQNEVGAEALYIHNLEALTQADKNNNEDYFSLMNRNIEVLRESLQ